MRSAPAIRWLLVAFACLAAAVVLAPATVPIYDGIGNPDEPYRYVNPPAGSRATKPPTTAAETLKVRHGRSVAGQVNTDEFGPQLALFVPPGALELPAAATAVTVTAAPVVAPTEQPSDGALEGNVYRITATASGGGVDLVGLGNQAPVLDLRAPTARQPGPVIEHFADGRWTSYETSRVGNDVYRTRIDALGDWALVRRHSGGGSSSSLVLPIVAGALGAGGLLVGVLAIRRRRRTGAAPDVSR